MAKKSDTFFIRADIEPAIGGVSEVGIDLGSYVDALGKSVLRIKSITARYTVDDAALGHVHDIKISAAGPGAEARASWQLTTQSQTTMVPMTDKSLIASGSLQVANATANPNAWTAYGEDVDVNPQEWDGGYLVGVEQIYLAGYQSNFALPQVVGVLLECQVETMTQNSAMALALSQQ